MFNRCWLEMFIFRRWWRTSYSPTFQELEVTLLGSLPLPALGRKKNDLHAGIAATIPLCFRSILSALQGCSVVPHEHPCISHTKHRKPLWLQLSCGLTFSLTSPPRGLLYSKALLVTSVFILGLFFVSSLRVLLFPSAQRNVSYSMWIWCPLRVICYSYSNRFEPWSAAGRIRLELACVAHTVDLQLFLFSNLTQI